jgi:hypothetical protein
MKEEKRRLVSRDFQPQSLKGKCPPQSGRFHDFLLTTGERARRLQGFNKDKKQPVGKDE